MAKEWISVKDRLPKEFEVVLTYHIKDLYPVASYYINESGKLFWYRETEGPEAEIRPGKHDSLYRPPTHWMPLPKPPENE